MNLARFTPCVSVAAAAAFVAACGPIHEWPYSENPHCTSSFCVELPGTGGASVSQSGDERCSNLDLIDDSSRWFSIEWCDSKRLRDADAAAFYGYWDGFAADYVARNFGDAHYQLLNTAHVLLPDGRPGLLFAASGTRSNGKPGALVVAATLRDGHAIQSYVLLERKLPKDFDVAASAERATLVQIAASVRAR